MVIDSLGYAAAKSVNRIPDSCGAHPTCAKASRLNLEICYFICLDEMHLSVGCMHQMVYLMQAKADRRGDDLAIAVTQSERS